MCAATPFIASSPSRARAHGREPGVGPRGGGARAAATRRAPSAGVGARASSSWSAWFSTGMTQVADASVRWHGASVALYGVVITSSSSSGRPRR